MNEESIQIISTFNKLPLDRKVEIFRGLSPTAREELLSVASRPADLTRKISEEEMFFSIKDLGEESALNLIRWTTGKQLTYILDIDLWKREMFDALYAKRWLNIISGLGEDKILQYLQVSDPESLVTTLNTFMKVIVRDTDIDLLEELDTLPSFTLDDTFYVHFRDPSAEDAVRRVLETAFNWNTEYYFSLMQELSKGIMLEIQETAHKWRQARLSEKGFPEFDEALEIYNCIQRNRLAEPLYESHPSVEAIDPGGYIGYPLKVIESNLLFCRSLHQMTSPDERDKLSVELAHLANKVMVADAKDPGVPGALRESLAKVSAYINLALEDLCGDDTECAIGLLRANHVEMLFRRGFSLIMDLRKDTQKVMRNYPGGVEDLGYPLAGLVQGLMKKRPLFAENFLGGPQARDFKKLEDLEAIRKLMAPNALEEKWEAM